MKSTKNHTPLTTPRFTNLSKVCENKAAVMLRWIRLQLRGQAQVAPISLFSGIQIAKFSIKERVYGKHTFV